MKKTQREDLEYFLGLVQIHENNVTAFQRLELLDKTIPLQHCFWFKFETRVHYNIYQNPNPTTVFRHVGILAYETKFSRN